MCAWLLTNIGKPMISTLVEEANGETLTRIKREQRLYSRLTRLSKLLRVIVTICGDKSVKGLLQEMTFNHLMVNPSVVRVNRDHVMVTLSSRQLNGHYGIDKLEIVRY